MCPNRLHKKFLAYISVLLAWLSKKLKMVSVTARMFLLIRIEILYFFNELTFHSTSCNTDNRCRFIFNAIKANHTWHFFTQCIAIFVHLMKLIYQTNPCNKNYKLFSYFAAIHSHFLCCSFCHVNFFFF